MASRHRHTVEQYCNNSHEHYYARINVGTKVN